MQTPSRPLVSTLICTYNAASFFDGTIRSVLNQTFREQEILIRDDGSTDGTLELLRYRSDLDDRITIFSDPSSKRGPYGGLNYLLDKAQGAYIAIQDHDDIWHPDKLECQIDFMHKHNDYEGCGSAYTIYIERYGMLTRRNTIGESYGKGIAHHTSLVYRKSNKRYDEALDRYVDLDFMLNQLGAIYELPSVYMMHRERADGQNLFSKRNWGFWNGLALVQYKITPIKLLYYIYRSIVGERILRWMSIHVFSKNSYTQIDNSSHTWLRPYLLDAE